MSGDLADTLTDSDRYRSERYGARRQSSLKRSAEVGGRWKEAVSPRISNRSLGRGIRSAGRWSLTSGADSGKTVVYTDRELTRPLLDHYGEFKDARAPQFNAVTAEVIEILGDSGTDVTEITGVSVSHGLRSSLSATTRTLGGSILPANTPVLDGVPPEEPTDDDRVLTDMDDSFSGSVHGVSGRFLCAGADGCMITVRGTYNRNVEMVSTSDENRLDMVTMSVDAGMLYFRPSSAMATVSLCDDRAQCTAGTDGEYMLFGWWRENPSSAAAAYKVDIFADVVGTPATNNIAATYDGTAAGMYVEQDPNNAVDTHRQGEFTADADLSYDGTNVSGTIDDFVTTPTGGSAAPRTADRWVVTLEDAFMNGSGDAKIFSLPGERFGKWGHAFVPLHDDAAANTDAPTVVGAFNTRILDFVHLIGSFGAEAR